MGRDFVLSHVLFVDAMALTPPESDSGSPRDIERTRSPKPTNVSLTSRREPRSPSPDSVLNDSSDALLDIAGEPLDTNQELDDESGSNTEVRDTSPWFR